MAFTKALLRPKHKSYSYCSTCGVKDSLRICEGEHHYFLVCNVCFASRAADRAAADACVAATNFDNWAQRLQTNFNRAARPALLRAVYEDPSTPQEVKTRIAAEILGSTAED